MINKDMRRFVRDTYPPKPEMHIHIHKPKHRSHSAPMPNYTNHILFTMHENDISTKLTKLSE